MHQEEKILPSNYINISKLLKLIKNKFNKILKFSLLITFIMLCYFQFKTPLYGAKVSFYTTYNKSNNFSVLNLLPSNFNLKPEDSLSFSIDDVLKSDRLLYKVVSQEYLIEDIRIRLVDYWGKDYNKLFTINPLGLILNINSYLMRNKNLTVEEKKIAYATHALTESIIFTKNDKTLLNSIMVVNEDPQLAYQVVENLYTEVVKFSYKITNSKGEEKRKFIELRLNDVKKEMENLEDELLVLVEKNKGLTSPSLLLMKNRLEQEIMAKKQIYITLSSEKELAAIDEKDDTSTIFLLDKPHILPTRIGLSLLEKIIFIFILSFISSLSYYVYKNKRVVFS
jgi:uncharacterized protein involved in exopolysaccharide biosynthesis